MTDIADEVTPESGLPANIAMLARLRQAAGALREAQTLEQAFGALLDTGLRVVKGTRGAVALLDPLRVRLEVVASSGYDMELTERWRTFDVAAPVPLAEAVRTGEVVVVEDLEALRSRYGIEPPDETPHALIAVPLHGDDGPVGAWGIRIDLDRPGVRLGDAAAASGLVGDLASARLAQNGVSEDLHRQVTQLQRALDSRVVLEQAKGVLAERHQLTPDEAFERLRRHARSAGTRLHDLAAEVVQGGTDPLAAP